MKTPYEILGITKDADHNQIRKAFLHFSMKYHPDRNDGSKEMEKKFIEVKAAYDFISKNNRPNEQQKEIYLHDWAIAINKSLEKWTELSSKDGKLFQTAGDWSVSELEEKLIRFFDTNGIDAQIEIYSRRQAFQADSMRYWMSLGLIEPKGSSKGEQSSSLSYGLTEKGNEYVQRKKMVSEK